MSDMQYGDNVELAPAKVNLALHVTGQRANGYHDLESLVAFADMGDVLSITGEQGAEAFSLRCHGPFAEGLAAGPDNLVLQAANALHTRMTMPFGAISLQKNLPIASGIGGGSADAAAIIRLLVRLSGERVVADEFADMLVQLGADVPMCYAGKAAFATGIGENLQSVTLPALPTVLVNPGQAVATPAIFRALANRQNAPLPAMEPGTLTTSDHLLAWLATTRNDLEQPAMQVAPVIGDVLSAIRMMEGCRFARMSGSGATCFGLFASKEAARRAADSLQKARPNWWVRQTILQ